MKVHPVCGAGTPTMGGILGDQPCKNRLT
ncbi:hypothetical protein ACF1AO_04970 [Streptomyces longwoodensis]